jgi:hypothetical protein
MKYLKSYKIFESNSTSDIEDILQDIKDDGHDIQVDIFNFEGFDRLGVFINFINSTGDPIDISEYQGILKHLVSFIENDGWVYSDSGLNSRTLITYTDQGGLLIKTLDLDKIEDKVKRLEFRFDKYK